MKEGNILPSVTIVPVAAPHSKFGAEASPFCGEYLCDIAVIVGPSEHKQFLAGGHLRCGSVNSPCATSSLVSSEPVKFASLSFIHSTNLFEV